MAGDTLQTLVEDVAGYLRRADIMREIAGFVRLAEKRLSRRLNLAENEVMTTLDLVGGRAPLPNDYASWRAVNGPPGRALEYAEPHRFISRYGGGYGLSVTGQGDGYDLVADGGWPWAGGRPAWFTIIGSVPLDSIDADPSVWVGDLSNPFILTGPAWAGAITLVYRQGLPPLGPDRPTNWLLERHYDLYLYATLLAATPFVEQDGRLPMWKASLEELVEDAQSLDRDARWGSSSYRVDEPTP